MKQPAKIADFQSLNSLPLEVIQSPERRLIENLANQANTIIERDGFNDDAKEIIHCIGILKQN